MDIEPSPTWCFSFEHKFKIDVKISIAESMKDFSIPFEFLKDVETMFNDEWARCLQHNLEVFGEYDLTLHHAIVKASKEYCVELAVNSDEETAPKFMRVFGWKNRR